MLPVFFYLVYYALIKSNKSVISYDLSGVILLGFDFTKMKGLAQFFLHCLMTVFVFFLLILLLVMIAPKFCYLAPINLVIFYRT